MTQATAHPTTFTIGLKARPRPPEDGEIVHWTGHVLTEQGRTIYEEPPPMILIAGEVGSALLHAAGAQGILEWRIELTHPDQHYDTYTTRLTATAGNAVRTLPAPRGEPQLMDDGTMDWAWFQAETDRRAELHRQGICLRCEVSAAEGNEHTCLPCTCLRRAARATVQEHPRRQRGQPDQGDTTPPERRCHFCGRTFQSAQTAGRIFMAFPCRITCCQECNNAEAPVEIPWATVNARPKVPNPAIRPA